MENRGFTTILDWMLDLPLTYREIAIYAIIYGFSQDGGTRFEGSLGYLARKTKATRDTARNALRKLMDEGLIERTIVNKNGVEFHTYRVISLGDGKIQGGMEKFNEGGGKIQPNNIDNNIDINTKSNKASRIFTPPTLTEIEAYCNERGNAVDAERFFNYYESNGWMVGKNRMKDWKAAVRTWEKSERSFAKPKPQAQSKIARLNEMAAQIMGGFKV
jgi:hypothetical protein